MSTNSINGNYDFMYQQLLAAQNANSPKTASTDVNFGSIIQAPANTSNGNSNGTILAGLGTLGAAGYGYFYSNPITEGKFDSHMIEVANQRFAETMTANKYNELIAKQQNEVLKTLKTDPIQYNAACKYAQVKDLAKLNESERLLVKNMTLEDAKAMRDLGEAEFKKIAENAKETLKEAVQKTSKYDLKHINTTIKNNNAAKSILTGLSDSATTADIEKAITENPEAFNIKATEEAAIKTEAKTIAQKGKKALLEEANFNIKKFSKFQQKLTNSANEYLTQHWDSTAKTFKEGTNKSVIDSLSHVKYMKALKYGGIALLGGIILNWAFGKNK